MQVIINNLIAVNNNYCETDKFEDYFMRDLAGKIFTTNFERTTGPVSSHDYQISGILFEQKVKSTYEIWIDRRSLLNSRSDYHIFFRVGGSRQKYGGIGLKVQIIDTEIIKFCESIIDPRYWETNDLFQLPDWVPHHYLGEFTIKDFGTINMSFDTDSFSPYRKGYNNFYNDLTQLKRGTDKIIRNYNVRQ